MYELERREWRTPGGHPLVGWIRNGTNDYNTTNSISIEDEYHLAGVWLTGLVLDVGGYVGTFGISAALDNPICRVVIVEPVPENVEMIKRNLLDNGLESRVELIQGAVGDGGIASIGYAYQGEEAALHHAFVGNAQGVGFRDELPHKTLEYRSLTIEELVPGTAELLKIDTEGAEWKFLATPAVKRIRSIVGEWHPGGGTQDEFADLLAPTHDVIFDGPQAGPGGFVATLRE